VSENEHKKIILTQYVSKPSGERQVEAHFILFRELNKISEINFKKIDQPNSLQLLGVQNIFSVL
jgi:hypothetical protein